MSADIRKAINFDIGKGVAKTEFPILPVRKAEGWQWLNRDEGILFNF